MGKIRIKTLGTVEEESQKKNDRVRREEKKKRLTHLAGLKGGQRIVDMSAVAPELPKQNEEPPIEEKTKKIILKKTKKHSARYEKAQQLVDHNKLYPLTEALDLVKKTSLSRFDGSVEVHINTYEKGIRGQVNLPHGTGRQIKVATADPSSADTFEALLKKIESGAIDFDILIATPAAMPKLARLAKILGPKGLMPNPKTGTISTNPEVLALKLSKGQTQFKTESESAIIHFVLGKVSFSRQDLEENFEALISAIGPAKIKNAVLCSTMGPAVKILLSS